MNEPKFGAPEETRTPKIWFLRPARIPFRHRGKIFGRGTENRTLINRLKAYYFRR